MKRVGLDTFFFVELARGNEEAIRLWQEIVEGENVGIVCLISVFELKRLSLRGVIPREFCDVLFEAFRERVCEVKELSWKLLEEAAYISHGIGMSAVDSLIYTACRDCNEIYTADSDFLKSGKKKPKIILMDKEKPFYP